MSQGWAIFSGARVCDPQRLDKEKRPGQADDGLKVSLCCGSQSRAPADGGWPCAKVAGGKENVNYAVKSSLLLSFLESVPDVAAKLKDPNTKDESFEEVVKSAQDAAVLGLVY